MSIDEKDDLNKAIADMRNTCISMATGGGDFSYEKYETQRAKLLTFPEIKSAMPDWLMKNRYGSAYWDFIKKYAGHYGERRVFLRSEFDDLEDYVKNDRSTPLGDLLISSFDKLDSSKIFKIWLKINERKKDDVEGAITLTQSMLETTLRTLLKQNGIEYENKEGMVGLYSKFKKNLMLDGNIDNGSTVKKINGGIISVISGIGEFRNEYGDAHGGLDEVTVLGEPYVDLLINLSGSMCIFLINSVFERRS